MRAAPDEGARHGYAELRAVGNPLPVLPRQRSGTRRSLVSLLRLSWHLEVFAIGAGSPIMAAPAALMTVMQCRQRARTAGPRYRLRRKRCSNLLSASFGPNLSS